MKRASVKGVLITLGIMAALGGLFGCTRDGGGAGGGSEENGIEGTDGIGEAAVDNTSGIVGFSYSYGNSIGGDSYSYDVKVKDGIVTLAYESMEYYDYGEMTCELPAEFPVQLEGLYTTYRLAEWDGFSKYDTWVMDGDGFSLHISFADKAYMSASGSNVYPKGYGAAAQAIDALFAPYTAQLLEAKRQEKIAEGIVGDLDFAMITFVQHGTAGSDEYHVMLSHEGVRTYNFDVQVKSESGEYLPAGEYSVYRSVSDETVDLPAIQALAEQYGLAAWYGWDETAADPDNAEWFQLGLDFGESQISAMGTAHPEGYDGFRDAFLTWLAAKVLEVQALPE